MSAATSSGSAATGHVGGLSARDEVLARLRSALDAPRATDPIGPDDVPRRYQGADQKLESAEREDLVATLVGTLGDTGAATHRSRPGELPATLAALVGGHRSVVLADGSTPRPDAAPPSDAAPAGSRGPEVVVDDGSATPAALAAVDAAVVRSAHAAAATGSLALSEATGGGRRSVSLLPDHLIVLLDEAAVCYGLPRLISRLGEAPTDAWTLVSGPSSTVDIGLTPVVGMHGPRRLDVVLIGDARPDDDAPSEPRSQEAP